MVVVEVVVVMPRVKLRLRTCREKGGSGGVVVSEREGVVYAEAKRMVDVAFDGAVLEAKAKREAMLSEYQRQVKDAVKM